MFTVLVTWRCRSCPQQEGLVLDATGPPAVRACLLDPRDGSWFCDCGAEGDACPHVMALVTALGAEVVQ